MVDEAITSSEDEVVADKSARHDVLSSNDGSSPTNSLFIDRRCASVALLTAVAGIIVLICWNYHQDTVQKLQDSVANLQDWKVDFTAENEKLRTESEQLKKQLLQSEKELLSVWTGVEKLRRYIRNLDMEGTCYTTFAYDFDYVMLSISDKQKMENYQNYLRDYRDANNKAEFLKNKNKEFIWRNDRRLHILVTHFTKMKQNAKLVIFSIYSPKEVIESLLLYFPAFKDLEIFVELEAPEPHNRVRDILLHIIPAGNLEWYEIMFISSEWEYPCCKQYPFDVVSQQKSLTEIEGMVKKEC